MSIFSLLLVCGWGLRRNEEGGEKRERKLKKQNL
jgi:hypothetical protein